MITAINSKTKKEISFNTISQNDVENTLMWMFGPVDYSLTAKYKTKKKVVLPCNIHDDFNLFITKNYLTEIDEDGEKSTVSDNTAYWLYIEQYKEFWKNKEPFKSFLDEA